MEEETIGGASAEIYWVIWRILFTVLRSLFPQGESLVERVLEGSYRMAKDRPDTKLHPAPSNQALAALRNRSH
jgi:hypothetical protein